MTAPMPDHLRFDGDWYRRRDKTPNRRVATLFGTITLWRYLYQPIHGVERSIFPLEIRLGLAAGRATPALAERVAHAAVDATQSTVLADLKRDQGVAWSVATLRLVIAATWEGMAPHFHAAQVAQVLAWMEQANPSNGVAQAGGGGGPGRRVRADPGRRLVPRGGHGHTLGLRPQRTAAGHGLPGADARARPGDAVGAVDAADHRGALAGGRGRCRGWPTSPTRVITRPRITSRC